MGGLECVITGLMDEFAVFFREKKHAREIFTLIVIMMSFSVALINVTPVSKMSNRKINIILCLFF